MEEKLELIKEILDCTTEKLEEAGQSLDRDHMKVKAKLASAKSDVDAIITGISKLLDEN